MLRTPGHYLMRPGPDERSSGDLLRRVYWNARCVVSRVDPEQWFPIAQDATKAREQAADALAVCAACPVRVDCLELALRHGSDFGAHGVWGGLVTADRARLRRL